MVYLCPKNMKLFLIIGLSFLGYTYCRAQNTSTKAMETQKRLKEKIALACKLTDNEQISRMNELHQTIFKKVDKTVERATSYELLFMHPDSGLAKEIFEFIGFEQLCCPWLNFQLNLQPANGPISLKMGNSKETKEMVKLVMELDKLQKSH
jgi:hypothetical protein